MPDGDGLAHRRVRLAHRLDLRGRDVLAAADDHVLEPAGDREPAVVVDGAEVAGAEPAAVDERRLGGGRIGVAGEHLGAPHEQLAGRRVEAQLDVAGRPAVGRARPSPAGRRRARS